VRGFVVRVLGRQAPPPRAHLGPLPAGRLLVTSAAGAWVVARDGSRRRLGPYSGAAWSPRGLYAVVWSGAVVRAVAPDGRVAWTLRTPGRVAAAAWSPDGFRVAYLSGGGLRVVAGDGTGDHGLAARVERAAPVWSPTAVHRLAYADRAGRVVVADADTRERIWRSARGDRVLALAWAPDGRRLAALTAGTLRVYGRQGRRLARLPAPRGGRNVALAFAPAGGRLALIRTLPGRSEALTLRADGSRQHRLFSAPGELSDLAFSPDGRWVLLGWRAADQWLFLHRGDRRVRAAGAIGAQFTPGARRPGFPRIAGWCC
jgi:Tol biopolymer transport system component